MLKRSLFYTMVNLGTHSNKIQTKKKTPITSTFVM